MRDAVAAAAAVPTRGEFPWNRPMRDAVAAAAADAVAVGGLL